VSAAASGARSFRPRLRVVAVWLTLFALLAAIGVVEIRDWRDSATESKEPQIRSLLPVPLDQVGVIEILYAGTLHRFERDATAVWFYHGHGADTSAQAHTHQADPALAPRIAKALAAFGRTRIERQFPRGPLESDYGVSAPEMFIVVYRPNDLHPLAKYAVGHVAPDGLSRYVLPDGRSMVVSIANYQIENLQALIKTVAGQATAEQLDQALKAPSAPPAPPAAKP
jgi:hypothetical protein